MVMQIDYFMVITAELLIMIFALYTVTNFILKCIFSGNMKYTVIRTEALEVASYIITKLAGKQLKYGM